jgi:hypothetical protein
MGESNAQAFRRVMDECFGRGDLAAVDRVLSRGLSGT